LSRSYSAFTTEFVLADDGSIKNALVYALRATQFATCEWADNGKGVVLPIVGGESPKRDWIFEWLRERNLLANPDDTPNGKVVIASQYTRVLFWLKEELANEGVHAEVLSGDVSQRERSRVQRLFQDESSSLRIVLLSAGLGVGIDLDVADDLIFVDIPRNPDIQEQVEDRIHRVSRMHNVTIWRLRSRGTIDVTISAKNDEVFKETRAMMDGVRAVDYDRKIMDRIGVE
jgi:SNF2 family DNA or RNA helicase